MQGSEHWQQPTCMLVSVSFDNENLSVVVIEEEATGHLDLNMASWWLVLTNIRFDNCDWARTLRAMPTKSQNRDSDEASNIKSTAPRRSHPNLRYVLSTTVDVGGAVPGGISLMEIQ